MALYDSIARLYDSWSRSVTEDIEFYVEEALASGGPVVELAVGTGRVAVPIAEAGIGVIGIDLSEGMLEVAREYARERAVEDLVDLRVGDICAPPVKERVPLAICPFRSLLHVPDNDTKLAALHAVHGLLEQDGRLVFDVFAPSREDVDATHGRWLEREPGIFERADWDEPERTVTLSVRRGEERATMALHWCTAAEWLELIGTAGFQLEHFWGWFDRRPYAQAEDMIFSCRRLG
jgi:SAM-dependent methyltransferase